MTPAPTPPNPGQQPQGEPGLDAAQQSLSDALRVSFTVLKALMFILLIVYLGSGITRVDEQNIAVRYRFGEQVGTYDKWYFGLPFPIEQAVMVPKTTQTVRLDKSFWYDNPKDESPEQLAGKALNPLNDSFLITGDTNVIHVQFEVNYQIDQADVEKYLKNVGTIERADELVRTAAERGMIHWIASANIEDIISRSRFDTQAIAALTGEVLSDLETGITVQQVLIDNQNQSMPNQVRIAYEEVTKAQADKVSAIQSARRTYDETLGGTAGGAHVGLLQMIRAYEAALGRGEAELAGLMRSRLDLSIRELRLPGPGLLSRVGAYQDAVTAAAGSDDAALIKSAQDAADALTDALKAPATEAEQGQPIAGEIAAAISKAKANRSQIATQARLDFERYASALDAYRKTPLVLANDRLQATREKVMSGLVQTIVGDFEDLRLETTGDPEVQEEIAEDELQRRREKAKQEEDRQRGLQ